MKIIFIITVLFAGFSCASQSSSIKKADTDTVMYRVQDRAARYFFYQAEIPEGEVAPFTGALFTTVGLYAKPVGKSKNGCMLYTLYNPGQLSTMRLYWLHENGGFTNVKKGCLVE